MALRSYVQMNLPNLQMRFHDSNLGDTCRLCAENTRASTHSRANYWPLGLLMGWCLYLDACDVTEVYGYMGIYHVTSNKRKPTVAF